MENETKKKSKVWLYVVIAIVVVIAVVGGSVLLVMSSTNALRETTVTAENFEEVANKLDAKMAGQDDLYYFTYAATYYIMRDGMAAATSGNTDENAVYASVYGKTVQTLIDEGKKIAEQNGLTIEQIRTQMDQLSNSVN